MIIPKREDIFHKIQLYRLLMGILDDRSLAENLYFKGGSCAAMLGWLDRFSLDLDFDSEEKADDKLLRNRLISLFKTLNFRIKNQSPKTLFFVLSYSASTGLRNTLKLSIIKNQVKANEYQPFYLSEIDRFALCQTKETIFANKLVAPFDRYEKYGTIAGRDFYDIHHFFSQGADYKKAVIEERRKKPALEYLKELKEFVQEKVKEKIISEDLSYLLPYEKFKTIRKTLKREVLILIEDEIKRG